MNPTIRILAAAAVLAAVPAQEALARSFASPAAIQTRPLPVPAHDFTRLPVVPPPPPAYTIPELPRFGPCVVHDENSPCNQRSPALRQDVEHRWRAP